VMDRMGMEEGEVIQSSMITSSIERAQRKVEENNFGMRKRLIEYDDVMNIQRDTIYKRRKNALFGERLALDIANIIFDTCADIVAQTAGNYEEFEVRSMQRLGLKPEISEAEFAKGGAALIQRLYEEASAHYEAKNEAIRKNIVPGLKNILNDRQALIDEPYMAVIGDGNRRMAVYADLRKSVDSDGRELILAIEKSISLGIIDQEWKEHLRDMDDLKQSVQNASYEQKDPLLIYKFEGVELFQTFLKKVNAETVGFLMKAGVEELRFQQLPPQVKQNAPALQTNKAAESESAVRPAQIQKVANRNDRVNVQYRDGSIKRDVKFKTVENDVLSGEAVLIN
jgi:preprotein translocase subunit SecA